MGKKEPMGKVFLILASLLINQAYAGKHVYTIAVIDTGISSLSRSKIPVCRKGSRDFTGTSLEDTYGHGTHISGLIDQYAKNIIFRDGDTYEKTRLKMNGLARTRTSYCQVILKFWSNAKMTNTEDTMTRALRWAIDIHVDAINISAGGQRYSNREYVLIKEALNAGIRIVAAAGNEGKELGKTYDGRVFHVYPAETDPRIIVVGNLARTMRPHSTSNYGKRVNVWVRGEDLRSYDLYGGTTTMTGTSQATAAVSGKLMRKLMRR